MQTFKNVLLIGSSHISKQSMQEIKKVFDEHDPQLVAVELDKSRLVALLSNKKGRPSLYDIKRIGVMGFLFAMIGGWVSKKLGKLVGVSPGSEMKLAVTLARSKQRQVALIDQPIQITLKRFSKRFSYRERARICIDIFNGLVLRKKEPLMQFDLNAVPEKKLIKQMIDKVRKRYPNLYKVIIEERNYYMARKLRKLIIDNPQKKIMAVVGAGHEDEIIRILGESSFTLN